jgi:hypothetical protein
LRLLRRADLVLSETGLSWCPSGTSGWTLLKKQEKCMPVIQLVIVLVIVGLVLWMINNYIPMQSTINRILNMVVIIGVIIWLLSVFGFIGNVMSIRVGK